jgi:predicted RNA-binding Zn ribbon-like protein
MEKLRPTHYHGGVSAPMLGEPLPVELMNTVFADRDGVHDALASPADLDTWLTAVRPRFSPGLADLPDAGAGPLREFQRLRDALRVLAADVTDDTRLPRPLDLDTATDVVNSACAYAPTWSAMSAQATRTRRSHHTFAEAALSDIAEQSVDLFTGAARDQLRACHAPTCVLFFIRNHPRREWCSASCGNRARVARHYRRHHSDVDTPSGRS